MGIFSCKGAEEMQSFLLGGDMPSQNVGFIHMTGKGRMDLGGGAAASVNSPCVSRN